MEIGWTLEWKRYSGGRWSGMDLSEIHRWLIFLEFNGYVYPYR